MKDKNRWGFLIAILLIVGQLSNTRTVLALGTPQIISIDPGSPSPVGTNVSIRASVTWDNEFRSMRICFRDTNWCQEDGSPDISKSFDTSGLEAGTYTILVQVSKLGEGWDSATSTSTSYELTTRQEQQPIEPPASSEPPRGPDISVFDFNPWNATVGDSVNIHISVDSNNPGATKFDIPCGGVSKFETSEREFDSIWNTGGCGAEEVTVRVCARDVNDQNWQNPSCSSKNYTLSSAQNNGPIPTAKFWVDATTIKYGDCTYLHWETSNAGSVEIDGVPIASSDKMQVCPMVTKHYSLSAKNYAGDASRSLTIVVGSTSSGSDNLNWSQQGPTGMDGNCPKAPAQLKPGDIAVVVRTDLNLRPQPGVDNTPIRIMPMLSYVTIISGPTCTVGSRWFEVGFEGSDGWAAEVGSKGEYHIIPNGQPLTGSDPTQNDSSKKVDLESGSGEEGILIEPPATGVIQIGGDIYLIIKGQRRLVPNPDTLEGLGISRNMIDNMGMSEAQLSAIPRGTDIPDIIRELSGFQAFKQLNDSSIAPYQNGSSPQPLQPALEPFAGQDETVSPKPGWCSVPIIGSICKDFYVQAGDLKCHPQCMVTARLNRPDMSTWIPPKSDGSTTPADVVTAVSKEQVFKFADGSFYSVHIRKKTDKDRVFEKDLVVWTKGCDNVPYNGGHIGFVNSVSGDSIWISDSNWGETLPDGTCSTRTNKELKIQDCMVFISSPGPIIPDFDFTQSTDKSSSATIKQNIMDWLSSFFGSK